MITQTAHDYVSPGPWVEKVESRVGVDLNDNGKIDQWTDWKELKESYDYIRGFSKQIEKSPATLDLSGLPSGFGFQVEVRMTDTTSNRSKPLLQQLALSFE